MSTPRTVSRSSVEGGATTPASDPSAAPAEGSDVKPKDDLNDEQAELERAIALEQEAYRAGEEARRTSVVTQASRTGGDVNHEEANNAGEKALERARQKALKKRPPGVYVTSPIKVQGQDAPVFAPIGYRLTDWMVEHLGEKQIENLQKQELVEDLR